MTYNTFRLFRFLICSPRCPSGTEKARSDPLMEPRSMTRDPRASLICLALLGFLSGMLGFSPLALSEDAKTYQLRYHFAKGQDLHYVCPNGASYLVQFAQAEETILHTSMFLRHMTVMDLNPDGTANIQLVLDRAYLTAKNAEVNSIYNSEKPDQVPTEFESVHASIGKAQNFRLSPLGKILPIAGQPDSVEKIDLVFGLPEQPIAIGATWKDRIEVSVPISKDSKLFRPVKMERRFELQGVEQGIATIRMSTVLLSPVNDPYQESLIMQQRPSGVIRFDIEQGHMVDRRLQIDEKVVGHEGPGSALTIRSVRVDQLIGIDQAKRVDLSKTPVPKSVAEKPLDSPK